MACCYTHGFFLVYLCVTFMLAIYQCATPGNEIQETSSSLVEGIVIAACLFVFCDSAHRATVQMGEFLETCVAHAPLITLGDYVVVNRALLVSMASAMVTYLVVLVQFKMASGADDACKHCPNQTAFTFS